MNEVILLKFQDNTRWIVKRK